MITATFSLFQQVINMKSFPSLRLTYTSETIQGQVYVPAVNWARAYPSAAYPAFSSLQHPTKRTPEERSRSKALRVKSPGTP